MSLLVVGVNHRTVHVDVLERMSVSDAELPKALHDLGTRGHLAEVAVLSTCNRTEIYAVTDATDRAADDVRAFLADLSGLAVDAFAADLYVYRDERVAEHLFNVASGVDSAVVGETEILGQVRSAGERAADERASGTELRRLFRAAVGVGRKAREKTGIARGVTSVSQAAVAMAADHLGSLDGKRILVLGAGDMGEGMAVALARGSGLSGVLVANRSWDRAVSLADVIGGTAIPLAELGAALVDVDLLLCSTAATSLLVDADSIRPVMEKRNGRPLLVVDVAVPRDVDPAVGDIEGVTLLDMDDLRVFAERGLEARRREITAVEAIVSNEVTRYFARLSELRADASSSANR